MKITQILNNNVALVKRGGHEVIVVSKGIGAKKKKGQTIEDKEIDKLYILDSYDMLDHFSYLLAHSDSEDILLVQRIVTMVQENLHIEASDSLVLTLLDHIDYVIKRAEKQQFIKSPLYWDIKRFYQKYFDISLKALSMIREQKNIEIPDDEAAALALHFINMEGLKGSKENIAKEINTTSDIIAIVERHFKMSLNENTINYMRFFTHLQYFVQRIIEGTAVQRKDDFIELHKQITKTYPNEFKAVQKIKLYVKSQYCIEISPDEEMYLTIHIRRVTERGKD